MNKNKNFNITNEWISGFTQGGADGSFIISYISTESGMAVRPVPVFNLTQSNLEYDLFMEIQKYLSIGKIYKNRQNVFFFVVKSIDDIVEVLLPFFWIEKYPLIGSKLAGYNIFKTVVLMIKEKNI